jgi:uncharacterized protein
VNLSNSFRIAAPIDEAWAILGDFPTIARCMPGAQLHEVRGDELFGSVTVRLGPMKVEYDGVARILEQDTSDRRMVIEGSGRDKRGGGSAKATIVAFVVDESGESVVKVETKLAITGRPAQMGQGLLQEVAEKIVDQFAERLKAEILSAHEESGPPPPGGDSLDLSAAAGPLMKRVAPILIAAAALFVTWWFFRRR